MLPSKAVDDGKDIKSRNAEHSHQVSLPSSFRIKLSNQENAVVADDRLVMRTAARTYLPENSVSMERILRFGQDFQIRKAVVVFDPVFVIGHVTEWYFPNEGCCHQLMNTESFRTSGAVKSYPQISVSQLLGFESVGGAPASNAPVIGYFVKSFISYDWAPFFCCVGDNFIYHNPSLSGQPRG